MNDMNYNFQYTENQKTLATMSHVLGLLLGFLGPLIIYVWANEGSAWVKKNAKEALNFQISLMIYIFAASVGAFFCIGIPFLFALIIVAYVLPILAAIKSNNGVLYKYPFTIKFIV